MRALAAHVPTEREDLLDTAGTGGGRSTLQRVDDGGADRRRRGLRGRQARQPLGDEPLGLGRPARGARRAHRPRRPTAVAACIDEAGFGFMFAPGAPSGDALRDTRAARAGGAHDLQPARAADEPGRRAASADRRVRPALPGAMAGALARLGVDRALVVAGEDGLDEVSAERADASGRGQRRGDPPLRADPERGRDRAGRGLAAAACGRNAGAERAVTRAILRADADADADALGGAGERVAGERLALINAGAAIYAAGRSRHDRGGRTGRARSARGRGARRARSSASCWRASGTLR